MKTCVVFVSHAGRFTLDKTHITACCSKLVAMKIFTHFHAILKNNTNNLIQVEVLINTSAYQIIGFLTSV